jgi:predicted outer membrane repeat protein
MCSDERFGMNTKEFIANETGAHRFRIIAAVSVTCFLTLVGIPVFPVDPLLGVTWNVPELCPTIQAGIDSAANGDTVLVSPGVYTGDGNRNIKFDHKFILVKSEDGPESTIIDCEGSEQAPQSGFLFIFRERPESRLDGFTVRNGYWKGEESRGGGGIYCALSAPTITNCIIEENGSDTNGGGICCDHSSSPLFENCTISVNIAREYGGGIYCNASTPTFTHCTIQNNRAVRGGGIQCINSPCTLNGCLILSNRADEDGGAVHAHQSDLHFNDCTISNNRGGKNGGGIFGFYASILVDGCSFIENSSEYGGGGIHVTFDTPHFSKCSFTGNTSVFGGALFFNGTDPVLENSIITANAADSTGGGIYCTSSSPGIVNCTFTDNNALGKGSGISCHLFSYPAVTNTILWGDESDEIYVESGNPDVTYSNIEGGWSGEGNIDENPLFAGDGDYHLTPDSPCVDTGTHDGAPEDDIDAQERPNGDGIDMGADEWYPTWIENGETAEDNPPDRRCSLENILHQNYPNPFNPCTAISYSLNKTAHVTLAVYDTGGRLVITLVDRIEDGGDHVVFWNGRNSRGIPAGSGIYIYRLQTGRHTVSRRMLLLK